MSSMLDRYLYAVQNDLPKDQPVADIVAEIGDDLQSQFDERSSTLGRPLTEEEQAAILKTYGHPRVVAGRYNRVQYLVGPEAFPFYFSALRLVMVVVVTIELLAGAISSLVTHNGFLFFEALGAAWNSLIWIFGIVTVIFALSERTPNRTNLFNPLKWDPRRLPAPNARPPVPRTSSIAEFIANFLALLVLLDATRPHHIPFDAVLGNTLQAMQISLTPAWHGAYIGTIAGTAILAASALVLFVRPQFAAAHEALRIVASVVTIAGIAVTLQASPLIESPVARYNTGALYFLIGAIFVLALQIAVSTRTLLRKPAAPHIISPSS